MREHGQNLSSAGSQAPINGGAGLPLREPGQRTKPPAAGPSACRLFGQSGGGGVLAELRRQRSEFGEANLLEFGQRAETSGNKSSRNLHRRRL